MVVNADPGMRITVNDQPVALKGSEESFTTPDLEPGRKYSYVIKAEGMGNGERTTTVKKVYVVAGEETRVDLRLQTTAREAAAKVTVLLPEDARLFVDDVPYPAMQEKVTFETPKLEPERNYYYTLRAEVVQDGKVYRDTRRVDLAAGKEVKVEFTNLRNASTAQR